MVANSNWRVYINQIASSHGLNIRGDFVDCGVHFGCNAISNITYTNFELSNKKYYLIDTFSGLSPQFNNDPLYESYKNSYNEGGLYELAISRFSKFSNVKLIKGVIPDILNTLNIKNVCYLHINLDAIFPEIEAFKYFWPKMSLGAIVILDDINAPGQHVLQYEAFQKQCEQMGLKMISLPTGQCMVIKS